MADISKSGSYGEKSGMYYEVPENYIYISHLDDGLKFWKIPFWPDSISDTQQSTFQETNALGRSAPVYTYSQTGPRKVQFQIELHRDWFDDVNMNWSNSKLGYGEDYVDNLIHALYRRCRPVSEGGAAVSLRKEYAAGLFVRNGRRAGDHRGRSRPGRRRGQPSCGDAVFRRSRLVGVLL